MLMLCTMTTPPPAGDAGALDRCLAAMAQGDREGLAELYRRTRAGVYGFALSMMKNPQDAEDVAQETYLRAWQGAGQYRSGGKPMAWLLTIARNLALDRLRERGRTASLDGMEGQEPVWQPAVTPEDRLALDALLGALGDEERQVVTLHAVAGLKHRETAVVLGLPLATVLSKYHRALQKLRTALKEEA